MTLISCMVTMQLICVFVLAYAKSRSHDAAQINCFYESRIIQLSKISQASNFCNANIMQTGPCNVHPFTRHFQIVKLGVIGVFIIFLFLLKNIDCGYLLEPPQ